ncbi:hypothetical protein BP6252_09987 [Coleophoma cylindrospora]|uniref:Geranylgeranyl pyrophosphate synthetase n=1 Tax=Coleophoma cylindrospora TaxID=1849047 RepID=A0A3D8QX34_9HELO|nr:hypothetical protein BP6252_09987 [Coleophoma cylindrospora]
MSFQSAPGRSNWRGRGRGRGGSRSSGAWRTRPEPQRAAQPFGTVVDTINLNTLLLEEEAPVIENFKYVASYNWVDGKNPVILVPGSPPAWTPPLTDSKLEEDNRDAFRDQNAARYPSFPLEPMIRSVQLMQPKFDLQNIDIVGCGSTLGNLVRFSRSIAQPFRFDVDVIEDTVFFVRRGSSPTELITDLRGYGHTFPEAYTTWDMGVRNSCSHQRIIQYELGGLKFLVRTETDAYIRPSDGDSSYLPSVESTTVDGLVETMAPKPVAQNEQLQILEAGTPVLQDQIFDIKTRSEWNLYNMDDILPRLWVSQTSKFLLAYHKFGKFNKPQVKDVKEEVLAWEKDNSNSVARFHATISHILNLMRDTKTQQCEISWDGKGPLQITAQLGEARRALPVDLFDFIGSK